MVGSMIGIHFSTVEEYQVAWHNYPGDDHKEEYAHSLDVQN